VNAAKQAMPVTPIVFAIANDPVAGGLVASLSRPGGNVTGLSLVSYGPNISDMFRRAANFVDKILHGTKPADIPVEQPTKFDLVINLTTAKALGLTLPWTLLALAEEVIE
jgi:ABC-type uncharacterized transport system substrate-binding protein